MNEINAKRLADAQAKVEEQTMHSLEYIVKSNYVENLVRERLREVVDIAVANALGMKENPWYSAHGHNPSDRFERIAKWAVSDPVGKAIDPHVKALKQSLNKMSFEVSEKVMSDLAASTQKTFEYELKNQLAKHAETKAKTAAAEMMAKIR